MPLTLNPFSVAELLKKETYTSHRESESLLVPFLSSIRNYDEYALLLRIFYGFFAPAEQLVNKQISSLVLADIEERRNAALLLSDLKSVGYTQTPVLCRDMPQANTIAAALGMLYVLEGSTLGGRMIKKMLLKNSALMLTEEQVLFFNGYGEATGEKWLAFQNCINQYEEDSAEIIASANNSFFKFSNWIRMQL